MDSRFLRHLTFHLAALGHREVCSGNFVIITAQMMLAVAAQVHGVLQCNAYRIVLQVIGVVTRKDVAEANAKLALGRKANLGLTTNSDSLTRPDSLPFIPYGAYDPTVGSSNMSHMEPIDEQRATDGIEMNYTLDGEWQNSRPQHVERRSGRRGRDDGDAEHSPLLDRSPGSGDFTDAV